MRKFLLKIIYAVVQNYYVNKRFIPVLKALLCLRRNNFNNLSPAFDPGKQKEILDATSFNGAGKILVCSLPKSGTTWLAFFFADYLSLKLVHPFFDYKKPGVACNHFPPGIDVLHRTDFLRCVYIIRDIRDIVCSYYHYASTPYHLNHVNPNYNPNYTIEEFYYKYFIGIIIDRYRWCENASMYAKLGVPVIKYEDLRNDQENTLCSLLEKSNIWIDRARIRRSLETTSMRNLQKQGISLKDNRSSSLPSVPPEFFRSGKSGGWKQDLPIAIVNDINRRFGDYLRAWGYEI